jgi:anti-repressor protein
MTLSIINQDTEGPTISGRELHERLEVKTAYKDWFPRMCEYGFSEGVDFCSKLSESTGGRPATDHQLTVDMAKEICMLQRTEQGKAVRRYLLDIEKQWNTPEAVMSRALRMASAKMDALRDSVKLLGAKIEQDKPKVLFAEAVSASSTSILIGDLAKLLRQNGVSIGQNRLFERLRADGFLMHRGESRNLPTQRAMEMGLFEVKETTIGDPDGSIRTAKTTKVTGKGQVYFLNRYLSDTQSKRK